jgi:ElaB/YqjD/DUF883 family membrane-anchored ribosome-binding protein
MNDTPRVSKSNGELRKSLNDVVNAAEALLRATVDETSAEYHKARTALDDKLRAAKSTVTEHAHEIATNAKEIGAKGDRLVRDNPWMSVGIGAGVGLLLGLILRRR